MSAPTALTAYSQAAQRSARVVITRYSTSFSLACRLLDPASARHISNIYALVRLADEIVDGVAAEAGLDTAATAAALDELQAATTTALSTGWSSNLVVHAFALSARATGITTELLDPFFDSMRQDLEPVAHTEESLRQYIYGSAEVIGLMCLQVFKAIPGAPQGPEDVLHSAARSLGAAFQKVNFLRDAAADTQQLGRGYLPGTDLEHLDDAARDRLVADIRADLAAARAGLPYLAAPAARAVRLAHDLFAELTAAIAAQPAAALRTRRISVSTPRKALLAARVLLSRPERHAA